jgi:hypothetical protein
MTTPSDKFKDLKKVAGFDDKFKSAGGNDKFTEAGSAELTSAKELTTALYTTDPDGDGMLLQATPETRIAAIEKIYGKGSGPKINEIVNNTTKNVPADPKDPTKLRRYDSNDIANNIKNYFDVVNKAAVETMIQSAEKTINADSAISPEQKRQRIARARDEAQRRVDEQNSPLTEDQIENFGTDLEQFAAKELKKVGKFDHQNFLLGNIDGLSPLSRRRFKQPLPANAGIRTIDNDKILALTDSATNPLSKLRRKDKGYGLLALPTEKLSQLVPTIKIFKIYSRPKTKKGKHAAISNEIEVPFPTTSLMYANTGKNFSPSGIRAGSQDPKSFLKNRDGFGIRSFTWDLAGKTEVTGKTDIKAKLSLYFQDFAQFITPRKNTKGESFRYLDLILDAAKLDDTPKGAVQYLKIVAGWAIPPSSSGAGSFTDEELDIIRENTISLKLGFVGYAIVFNDSGNGTFELSIEYQAWAGEFTTDKFVNVLLPSKDNCKTLGALSKTIADAQANNQTEVGGKKITVLETERNALQKSLIPETQTRILELLTKAGSIYELSVPAGTVLDFQGVDPFAIDLALASAPDGQKDIEFINSLVEEWDGVGADPAEDDN